jgi:hypothetical protein
MRFAWALAGWLTQDEECDDNGWLAAAAARYFCLQTLEKTQNQ